MFVFGTSSPSHFTIVGRACPHYPSTLSVRHLLMCLKQYHGQLVAAFTRSSPRLASASASHHLSHRYKVSSTFPSHIRNTTSLFAANDLAHSAMAGGTILFSRPMSENIGVAAGVSLLAGYCVICVGFLGILWWYGATLRAKSRFAVKQARVNT